jgi:hypothetical protein
MGDLNELVVLERRRQRSRELLRAAQAKPGSYETHCTVEVQHVGLQGNDVNGVRRSQGSQLAPRSVLAQPDTPT